MWAWHEAAALAGALRKILRDKAPLNVLETCDREWQAEWQRLLGLTGGLKAKGDTSPWVRERRARILSCLPASHEDLAPLGGPVGARLLRKSAFLKTHDLG